MERPRSNGARGSRTKISSSYKLELMFYHVGDTIEIYYNKIKFIGQIWN